MILLLKQQCYFKYLIQRNWLDVKNDSVEQYLKYLYGL